MKMTNKTIVNDCHDVLVAGMPMRMTVYMTLDPMMTMVMMMNITVMLIISQSCGRMDIIKFNPR